MTEENQTGLEEQLRGLSRHFNHEDKAYAILSLVAQKGLLPELETQLATLLENRGKKADENTPRVFSVQLLADYLEGEKKFYREKPIYAQSGSLGSIDLKRPVNTDGRVVRLPSLDDYDGWLCGK